MMKIKLTQSTVAGGERHVLEDKDGKVKAKTIDVDDAEGRLLVNLGRATKVEDGKKSDK